MGSWEVFWVFFYGFATYGNAGFMREQVCKYMCPYARFQSAMFDHDTLIVTYDSERGEPRGSRSRQVALSQSGLGSCVDCSLCVQVCPTGIDIRQGLQYECIGCGACADVCDGVMDKMGYDKGLVRYTTQNALTNHWDTATMLKRVFRPRVLVYTAILWTLIIALGISLWMRTPMKVNVLRDRGTLARITPDGNLENVFRLQIMNATEVISKHVHSGTRYSRLGAERRCPCGGVACPIALGGGRCVLALRRTPARLTQNLVRCQQRRWQRQYQRSLGLRRSSLST
jgi:cytochrome c oxidase accessory protein FixG